MPDKHVASSQLIPADTNTCAELRSAIQHSVHTVWYFSADKYLYNKIPARHILSLFWLLYISNEVYNAITCTFAYAVLSPSYAYGRFCIWQTNFPGPTESVVSEFTCTKWCKTPPKMAATLEHRYSFERTQRELSNEYQHDRVWMVFKNLCVTMLWMTVASALQGLRINSEKFQINISPWT